MHKRERLGISKFMRAGLTISHQTGASVTKYIKYMQVKFPEAGFVISELRSRLTSKLAKKKGGARSTPTRQGRVRL